MSAVDVGANALPMMMRGGTGTGWWGGGAVLSRIRQRGMVGHIFLVIFLWNVFKLDLTTIGFSVSIMPL